jgi:hypothetical protein
MIAFRVFDMAVPNIAVVIIAQTECPCKKERVVKMILTLRVVFPILDLPEVGIWKRQGQQIYG